MDKQTLALKSTSTADVLAEIEQSLIDRCTKTTKQIRRSIAIILIATALALMVPFTTWIITLTNSTSSDEGNLALFAFSSIPIAGVFVLISMTMLRRRRSLEGQLERIEDRLFEFRKLRAIAQTNNAQELRIFKEIIITKSLAGPLTQPTIEKEENDVDAILNTYSSLLKTMNDVRSKNKP